MSRDKTNAVLFDLGKVILDFDFSPAFKKLSKVSDLSPEGIQRVFMASGLEVLYDGGKISSREFYGEVKKMLGHSLSFMQFKTVWNNVFTPDAAVIRLICKLEPRTRLVLISNTNAMHYEYVRKKYKVLSRFDSHVLSFKERVRKPDERIYRKAAGACLAKPSQIFYIDDREDLTEAARRMGFRVFHYKKNHEALLAKMSELRIL